MDMQGRPYGKLAISGVISLSLYLLLFFYEDQVMANYTRTDGFYPALPVVTALAFSFAHGSFTAYFWEMLGVRGRHEKGTN